ncbi:Multidrug resistance regulator 1 [Colletotrichum siamense]|nr:Multidrug resistance regulator 1 [Colletotrichum siamense]
MEPHAASANPPARRQRKKVSAACQRCRRQKLKCDVQRPCTLCVRAEVECVNEDTDRWRIQGPQLTRNRPRRPDGDKDDTASLRRTKRSRQTVTGENDTAEPASPASPEAVIIAASRAASSPLEDDGPYIGADSPAPQVTPVERSRRSWPSNSAAMTFMDEAFQHQDATTPGEADTSAFAANQWSARSIATSSSRAENGVPLRPSPHTPGLCQSRLHRSKRSSDAERALVMTLPKKQVAKLLIDNYFDKIHWCFLIFFQDEFKERFENLFNSISRDDGIKGASISFVSLVLGIAQVGSTSEFNEVAGTYAVSFVALHLFTAGVALSILTSLEPLSRESFESKMGLRQLVSMHSQLKAKSIVAEQGFEILKRLMTLVMSKETERMLQFEGPADKHHGRSSDSTQRTSSSIEVATQSNSATGAGESLPSTDFQGTSQDDLMSDSRPDIPEDSAQMSRSDLGFCEDPLVTQALLDFEQAMSYDPNGVLGGSLAEFGDPFVESCFGAHDQGWIWNPRN